MKHKNKSPHALTSTERAFKQNIQRDFTKIRDKLKAPHYLSEIYGVRSNII